MKRLAIIALFVVATSSCQSHTEPTEVADPSPTEPTTAPVAEDEPATANQAAEADGGTAEADAAMLVSSGEQVYGRVCVTCHGPTGDGQGLDQQLFSFGSPEAEWKNGPTVDGIMTTLAAGIHDTSMKSFPDYGEPERRAVAHYVLKLRAELTETNKEAP